MKLGVLVDEKSYTVTKDVPIADVVKVGEKYEVELLESLMGTAHLVGASLAVHLFTGRLP